jgi:hypothetical protein
MDIRATQAKIPLRDRVVYGIVLALFLGGLGVQPVWRALEPRMTLYDLYSRGEDDPWGRPFEETLSKATMRSLGPNGVDDGLVDGDTGDDIHFRSTGLLQHLYANAPQALMVLAGIVAVLWELIRWSRKALARPKGALATELGLAASLAAVPSVAVFGVGWWVLGLLDRETVSALEDALIVPLPVALAGSAFGLTLMGFLSLRLRERDNP